MLRIGIDNGKVITNGDKNDPEDTSFFGDNFLKTPMVPDAFEGVKSLVSHCTPSNTYLISKCGAKTAGKSLWYLGDKGYFAPGMLDIRNVRFCLRRQDKAPIAAELRLDVFIDDKIDVLIPMTTVGLRILFGPQAVPTPPGLIAARTWKDVLKILKI